MKLNIEQTKLVGLTMRLDLKAREYKKLCKQLEEYKKRNLDKNSNEYKDLLKKFKRNQEEIMKINEELKELKKNKGEQFQTNSER